jgi:hypothetical protein
VVVTLKIHKTDSVTIVSIQYVLRNSNVVTNLNRP